MEELGAPLPSSTLAFRLHFKSAIAASPKASAGVYRLGHDDEDEDEEELEELEDVQYKIPKK